MHRAWLALVLAVVPACHLRAGLDAASRAKGPLHAMMQQATVSRENGVINLPPEGGNNYTLEAGFGTKRLTVSGLFAVHDVNSTSFTPGAGQIAATVGANARLSLLDWRGLSPSIAAGPTRMMLLDRETGERTWGNGVRFSAGAQYQYGPIAVYADMYRELAAFGADTTAQGTTTFDGVTVGVALTPQ